MAEALSDEQLSDLIGYLYGFERYATQDRAALEHLLLHGKKRSFFYLSDKGAYKTIKCLLRHPDRPLHLTHYPIAQLLELGVIEEVPSLTLEKDYGWYQIREEAYDFAQRIARTRHYEPLIVELKRQDEILFGLFHSYGMLELNQCCDMLKQYGIEMDPQHLFSSLTWRLSRREVLQGIQLQRRNKTACFIILRGLDFMKTYHGITAYPHLLYEFKDESEIKRRSERYFASEFDALIELRRFLLQSFSRRFTKTILQELIDAYQYHVCDFTFEETILRVFDQELSKKLIEKAITALPDIYLKSYSADEIFSE